MKKKWTSPGLVLLVTGFLFAFNKINAPAIRGRIIPADGAETVWAISGKDSTRAVLVSGSFAIQVKPGLYQVIIDAKEPYKDISLENLEIGSDHELDLGEIILQQ